MESARCRCPVDSQGTRCGRHPGCAIHGMSSVDPSIPWLLTAPDRAMLKSFRIATVDAEDLTQLREADQERFKNPPRLDP